MTEEIKQKNKEEQEIISFLNRDLERKSLNRSAARDELSKKEEEDENDDTQ